MVIVSGDKDDNVDVDLSVWRRYPDLPAAGVVRQGICLGHLKLPYLSEYGNAFQIPAKPPL